MPTSRVPYLIGMTLTISNDIVLSHDNSKMTICRQNLIPPSSINDARSTVNNTMVIYNCIDNNYLLAGVRASALNSVLASTYIHRELIVLFSLPD